MFPNTSFYNPSNLRNLNPINPKPETRNLNPKPFSKADCQATPPQPTSREGACQVALPTQAAAVKGLGLFEV